MTKVFIARDTFVNTYTLIKIACDEDCTDIYLKNNKTIFVAHKMF